MHLDFTKMSFSVETDCIFKSISTSTIAHPISGEKRVSSPLTESSRLSKYRRIDLEEDSGQSQKVALGSVGDLSVRCSPTTKNRKKVAKMMKRSHDSSFSTQSNNDWFFLLQGSSFCSSPKDQLAKRSEPAKRSIKPC